MGLRYRITHLLTGAPDRENPESLTGAIYGGVIATAIVVAAPRDGSPGVTAFTMLFTSVVFWLAHVHARTLALSVAVRRRPTVGEIRHEARVEWPIVLAAVPLAVPLVLGALGVFSDVRAHRLAIGVGLLVLLLWGLVIGRRRGMGAWGTAWLCVINVGLGLAMVVLKALVSH
jgi:hypothetical protein